MQEQEWNKNKFNMTFGFLSPQMIARVVGKRTPQVAKC